jgi:UTP--glucose-1-phosphate uridylyltransferase
MSTSHGLAQATDLMSAAGVHPSAIAVFAHSYSVLASGETGIIPESELEPIESLPRLADLEFDEQAASDALGRTAVVKLNGGLGTSMGMDRAKSLVEVHGGRTFLDLIVEQVLGLRKEFGVQLPLLFMNSFRTQDDTLAALAKYPQLATEGLPADFLQNREPKLLADGLTPVRWPANPELEWCPPGHGDLYPALDASGVLDQLLDKGFQ